MINLEHLTEEERKIIMDVLQRDEQLRQVEQERVKSNTSQIRLETGDAFGPQTEGQSFTYGTELVKMSLAKSFQANGRPQSPADSGFHGRGPIVPSHAESNNHGFDEDYPSDNSYEQSIGPSVSQRGSVEGNRVNHTQDDGPHASNGSTDITMERVNPRTGTPSSNRRGRQGGDTANANGYKKPPPPQQYNQGHDRGNYQGRVEMGLEATEDSRGMSLPPPIPTIAIHDAADSSYSEGEYYGSDRLHKQTLEANYRDSNMREEASHQDVNHLPTSQAANEGHNIAKEAPNGHANKAQFKSELETAVAVQRDRSTKSSTVTTNAQVHVEMEPAKFPDVDDLAETSSLPPDNLSGRFTTRSATSSIHSPIEKRLSRKNMMNKGSTSSLTSLYSTGEEFYGKYPITGDVSFGLGYNFKTNVFEVKIGGCRDLVPIDAKKNKSDPYIKTYLLPDKTKNSKRKTRTKKGTINPNYSENLKYPIAQTELETRTLSVAVWHYDRFGHNMFLGEVLLPLDNVDLTAYPTKWHQLKTRVPPTETKPISYKGDVVLALMFETTKSDENKNDTGTGSLKSRKKKKGLSSKQVGGCLKVHIKEAKNLSPPRLGAVINPYIKLYLEPDRSKSGKKKTAIMRNTLHPSYEQTLEFPNVTEDILKERALEVGVWDNDLGSSPFLGGVRLGLGTGASYGRTVEWQDSTGIEIQLWEEMLRNHNQWVEASLSLRASFD